MPTFQNSRMWSEHEEQAAFFDWCARQTGDAYGMAYAIPNAGKRHFAVAGRLKSEGMRAGVLDVNFDWPSKGFHGARIEFKDPKKNPTKPQKEWIEKFTEAGYLCFVANSWGEAACFVLAYLGEDKKCEALARQAGCNPIHIGERA